MYTWSNFVQHYSNLLSYYIFWLFYLIDIVCCWVCLIFLINITIDYFFIYKNCYMITPDLFMYQDRQMLVFITFSVVFLKWYLFFVQINSQIVAQWLTLLTNDVTLNIKIKIHIFPFLQDILNVFCIILSSSVIIL